MRSLEIPRLREAKGNNGKTVGEGASLCVESVGRRVGPHQGLSDAVATADRTIGQEYGVPKSVREHPRLGQIDMAERSGIEWTNSTWNPVTGCTKLSAGCDNCYAHALAHGRLREMYSCQLPVVDTPESRENPFSVRIWPERLHRPAEWKKPRCVFVNSMSDLFHRDVPRQFLRQVFRIMLQEERHVYQILTRRPARAASFIKTNSDLLTDGLVPAHIWIGVSVEHKRVMHRLEHLRAIPASMRFLSCEPLLGPLDLELEGIHWVIAGGESGASFRPIRPEWVREVRDQCREAGVPFFFKQWGGRTPKAGGRELDGRIWDGMPLSLDRSVR